MSSVPRGRTKSIPTVAILQRYMPHYRVAFFNLLKTRLSEHGVELKVYYGLPTGRTRLRGDAKPLDWATQVRVRSLSLGSRDLYWEDCVVRASEADLVILEASLGILSNLPVLLLRKLLQKTVDTVRTLRALRLAGPSGACGPVLRARLIGGSSTLTGA